MNVNRRTLYAGIGLIALVALVVLALVIKNTKAFALSSPPVSVVATDSYSSDQLATSAPPVIPAGYLPYSNAQYHFSLYYPSNLPVQTYNEAGGAFTATFENADDSQAFEIYVTPYTGTQITQARFKTDEPSGVVQPTDVTIDGVRGTMFFGNNTVMGDTREMWFVRDGFLYEVTTYKDLDSWLGNIVQTWKFI